VTLAERWEQFRKECVPAGLPQPALEVVRRAFYAGAVAHYQLDNSILELMPETYDEQHEALEAELQSACLGILKQILES